MRSSHSHLSEETLWDTRAVHLELVPDFATETFCCVLRYFDTEIKFIMMVMIIIKLVSHRGVPGLNVIDKTRTFEAASKKLIALFRSARIRNYLNEKKITWKYNLAK